MSDVRLMRWSGVDFHRNGKPELGFNGTYSAFVFVDEAKDVIRSHQNASKPLFLYVAMQSVVRIFAP